MSTDQFAVSETIKKIILDLQKSSLNGVLLLELKYYWNNKNLNWLSNNLLIISYFEIGQ